MKLTRSLLKQIIKEELDSFLAEDDFDEMDKPAFENAWMRHRGDYLESRGLNPVWQQ